MVKCERNEAARFNQEGVYKNNIQEYRDKKHQINKLLTLLASQEVDKWSVYDLNKIINWKNVKDVDVTPVSKKDLIVL